MAKLSSTLRTKAENLFKKSLQEQEKLSRLPKNSDITLWQKQNYEVELAEQRATDAVQAYKIQLYNENGWEVPVDLTIPKKVSDNVTKAVKSKK